MTKQGWYVIKLLLLGFGIGVFVALFGAEIIYISRVGSSLPPTAPTLSKDSTPSLDAYQSTATIAETIPPPLSDERLLSEAESEILANQPDKAEELLLPVVDSWISATDKVRGFKLLGDAEVAKGHYQLAAPYYEKIYFYNPTPDNLFTVAVTQDMGGDLCDAFKNYQILATWEDPTATFDRNLVETRIKEIKCVLVTRSP